MGIGLKHPSFMPSGDLFHFKQFSLDQAGCGMRIGTDGVLLGAWASVDTREETPLQILDVGCGTGLIALMLAQRYPRAEVTALEIEPTAVERATYNVAQSPFSSRVRVVQADFSTWQTPQASYDLIVSNPPYYKNTLQARSEVRHTARAISFLSPKEVLLRATALLSPQGIVALVTPYDQLEELRIFAFTQGLTPTRLTAVHTTPGKRPKRLLSEWTRRDGQLLQPASLQTFVIHGDTVSSYSPEYLELVRPFYTFL
nr:methyltransferase [uncultured Porphyromonas sp.]